ncbi:cyanoexosortase B system-associated protein [Leptolyngbya sp. FACHB-261]|uniref:cyanoexosortase B system-associated protein n=1 Tax=Leptolyngbya sp. FACHB-261 TaxID=2692806 RepID=UPI00168778F1|nr:cyanoexosortase B system-associated protein [Leptolyngbya sp. FACHB-261]MBD2105026.1 cyanoexosortase B system-associated protein [Leptolyngbya sp. FACHB-261]
MVSLAKRFAQPSKLVVLALLLVICLVGALPEYRTGHWGWQTTPTTPVLKRLQHFSKQGLTIPGWQSSPPSPAEIGGQKWLVQKLSSLSSGQEALLLLLPQRALEDKPRVEWMDLEGVQSWTTDSLSERPLSAGSRVQARYLRGWNSQATNAVLEWYAWPDGGAPQLSSWFWADLRARLARQRQPWVAIAIVVPIEPLAAIEPLWPELSQLGDTVQKAFEREYFQAAA